MVDNYEEGDQEINVEEVVRILDGPRHAWPMDLGLRWEDDLHLFSFGRGDTTCRIDLQKSFDKWSAEQEEQEARVSEKQSAYEMGEGQWRHSRSGTVARHQRQGETRWSIGSGPDRMGDRGR